MYVRPKDMTDEQFIEFIGEACRHMVGVGPPITDRWTVVPRRRDEGPSQGPQQNTNFQFQDVGQSISNAIQSFQKNPHMPALSNLKAPILLV